MNYAGPRYQEVTDRVCGRTNTIYYLVVGQCSGGSARGLAYREAAHVSVGQEGDDAIVYRGEYSVLCRG